MNSAQKLHELGQSVWYDNISRDLLQNGELARMICEWGVRGLTSNPTIFDQAISKSSVYDQTISILKTKHQTPDSVFEELALEDIAAAADLLRPIYDSSKGDDGFVSIEVSPLLAANTSGTIEEGRRLYKRLSRPNIMIKVPGTPEGIPAVQALLEDGVNVNITLLFSVSNYIDVAKTFVNALRTRVGKNQPIDKIRSVASFFVSRVDSIVDKRLEEIAKQSPDRAAAASSLLGKFGIANSKLAYHEYLRIFGKEFDDLRKAGGVPQRPLWASTSTKNPKYRDVMYVEELIGRDTVNTMPHQTVEAFVDHGIAKKDSVISGVEEARSIERSLREIGVDLNALMLELQVDGVKKFSESFVALNNTLKKKMG